MDKGKYWYKFYITECPVCGRDSSWKERQYIEKPEDRQKRYDFKQVWCYCNY